MVAMQRLNAPRPGGIKQWGVPKRIGNKNQGTHARAREDDVAWAREGAAVLGMLRCLDEG
jgi:hypothetical protein